MQGLLFVPNIAETCDVFINLRIVHLFATSRFYKRRHFPYGHSAIEFFVAFLSIKNVKNLVFFSRSEVRFVLIKQIFLCTKI